MTGESTDVPTNPTAGRTGAPTAETAVEGRA